MNCAPTAWEVPIPADGLRPPDLPTSQVLGKQAGAMNCAPTAWEGPIPADGRNDIQPPPILDLGRRSFRLLGDPNFALRTSCYNPRLRVPVIPTMSFYGFKGIR